MRRQITCGSCSCLPYIPNLQMPHTVSSYHGGWLAPNIYFLGHAGSVLVNGIRISGASGIFKSHDFLLGPHPSLHMSRSRLTYHFKPGSYEKLPYDSSSMRSIYHIREFCVKKLSLVSSPLTYSPPTHSRGKHCSSPPQTSSCPTTGHTKSNTTATFPASLHARTFSAPTSTQDASARRPLWVC